MDLDINKAVGAAQDAVSAIAKYEGRLSWDVLF